MFGICENGVKWLLISLILAVFLFIAKVLLGSGTPSEGSVMRDAIAFLNGRGVLVNLPGETDAIELPEVFDEMYKSYNEIQIAGGFDLTPYRGETVTRYRFLAPDYGEDAFAEVLYFDNKAIGGDIYSTRLDGFIISLPGG